MVAIDIETIPDLTRIDALPEPEGRADTKDPEKIAAQIAEKRKKQIEDMALSPFTGRICSFATWGEAGGKYRVMREISDAEEIVLVNDLLRYFVISGGAYPQICTWNGWKFDIPFIFKRAMLLRVELPPSLPPLRAFVKKYDTSFHMDLAQELDQWGNGYTSLDQAARYTVGEGKAQADYTQFCQMIVDGNQDKIGLYNLKDAELTYKIYLYMSGYIF
jgi:predicted PolB exonuclease-like 3'-5' exonuclease